MSRIRGRLQQTVNRNIQFRNIKFRHFGVLLLCTLSATGATCERGVHSLEGADLEREWWEHIA